MGYYRNGTMKRILFVSDTWHPQVNGVVTVLVNLINQLEARGYSCSIAHPGLFYTVPFPFYKEIRLAILPRSSLRAIIRRDRPDAIHIMTEGPLGIATRSVCRELKIPFTTSYHTHFHLLADKYLPGSQALVSSLLRRFHCTARRTIVSTEGLQRYLTDNGFLNTVVCPFGIDIDYFSDVNKLPLSNLQRPIFVYAGRVAKEKNIEEFLALQLPGTKIVIGDGPHKATLESRYDARFFGYKKNQEFVQWLASSDVMVFPSITDTFGLIILEALACGLPVAAHDAQGPRDILTNGVDGFMSNDLKYAAEQCLLIDRNKCRETARRYTWQSATDKFVDIISRFD